MKDWSRKPYQSKLSYPDFIRGTPARALWNSITEQNPVFSEYGSNGEKLTAAESRYLKFLKQSEAKKPYLADDYQSMEYDWEGLPGLIPDNPHIDHPWMPDPQPTQTVDIEPPGYWILYAFTEDEFCTAETKNIIVHGTHPIYNIKFTWPGLVEPGTSFTIIDGLGTNTVEIALTAGVGEIGLISMQAYEEAFDAPPLPSTQGRGWTGFQVFQAPKADCHVFTFQITRDDGQAINSGYMIGLPTIQRSDLTVQPAVRTYDIGTNTWTFKLIAPFDPSNLYYVSYDTWGGDIGSGQAFNTQYPFKYKPVEQDLPGNLIVPGDYTDHTPYYKILLEWDLYPVKYADLPDYNPGPFPPASCQPDPIFTIAAIPGSSPLISAGGSILWRADIGSSIPYGISMASQGTSRQFTVYWAIDNTTGPGPFCPQQICGYGGNLLHVSEDTLSQKYDLFDGTVVETVSDGLAQNTYSPTASASVPPYNDGLVINSPSISGKTHTFEYTQTSPKDDMFYYCGPDPADPTKDIFAPADHAASFSSLEWSNIGLKGSQIFFSASPILT